MTTYGAYNAGLPCKNPSCKSHGQPHPNCRCYGDFAQGGEAYFCSENRPHQPGCEYFAEGGAPAGVGAPAPTPQEPPDVIADADNQPAPIDQPPVNEPPDFIPDPPAEAPAADEPPDFIPDAAQYETPKQQAAAIGEGVAQGVFGPAATAAELGYGQLNPQDRGAAGRLMQKVLPGGAGLAVGTALDLLATQGLTPEDITGRQAANPMEHAVGEGAGIVAGSLLGIGEAGLINKGLAGIKAAGGLAQVGANALKGFISNALIQGGDEISKAMLGQGDPEAPVASALVNMGAAGLLGAGGGAAGTLVGQGASHGLRKMAADKAGAKLFSAVAGFGTAAQHAADSTERAGVDAMMEATAKELPERFNLEAYEAGKKAFDEGIQQAVSKGVTSTMTTGAALSGTDMASRASHAAAGFAASKLVSPIIGSLAKGATRKVAVPMVLRMMSTNGAEGLLNILNHADNVAGGAEKLGDGIGMLFNAGTQQKVNEESKRINREKLREYIDNGGVLQNIQQEVYDQNQPPQGYAEGGMVTPSPEAKTPGLLTHSAFATHFPEQNLLLEAARGRVSQYLSGLRPSQHVPKLAFDDAPDTTEKERTYTRALDIANDPLSVLHEIKRGTVLPEHVAHLNAMYPEVVRQMQKGITEHITRAQMKDEKPSYRVRQGLSLLMGTPLDGTLSPQGIQAAQATFQAQRAQAPQQPPTKPKHGTAPLSKAPAAYMTPDQSRAERQNQA